jgi:hypothetical protein
MRLNREAFKFAKQLINDGCYTMKSGANDRQPQPSDDENLFLRQNGWGEYGKWYLGINLDKNSYTKKRYEFPIGDFKTVSRRRLIAAKQWAAENKYTRIEQAASDLLEMIYQREGLIVEPMRRLGSPLDERSR